MDCRIFNKNKNKNKKGKNVRNVFTLLVLMAALMGCSSKIDRDKDNSKQSFDNAYSITSMLKTRLGADYIKTFESIGAGFGVEVNKFQSDYGSFHLFQFKTGDSWPTNPHPFYTSANDSFSKWCSGTIMPLSNFESAAKSGFLNPLHYTSKDKLELMKKNSRNGRYLDLSFSHMIDRDNEEYRSRLSYYNRLLLNDPKVVGKEYFWRIRTSNEVKGAQLVCFKNGRPHGAVIYKTSYDGIRKNSGSIYPKPGSHALDGIYIPPETTNNIAQYAFKARYANAVRQNKDKIEKENRKVARLKREKVEREAFELEMKPLKDLWANRVSNNYTLGKEVCTYNNKFGYVEQIANNRVKVLWSGQVTDKINGWFFGNRSLDSDRSSTFKYSHIDKVTWENKEKISYCGFDL
jgi:hypothetical protein